MKQLERKKYLFENSVFLDKDFVLIKGLKKGVVNNYYIEHSEDSTFGICTCGKAEIFINKKHMFIKKQDLMITPPGANVEIINMSHDFDGCLIAASEKFSKEVVFQSIPQLINLIIYVTKKMIIHLEDSKYNFLVTYLNFLWTFLEQKETIFMKEAIRHLITAISFWFYSLLHIDVNENVKGKTHRKEVGQNRILSEVNEKVKGKTRQDEIVEHFLMNAGIHFRENRKVNYYADLQCITPKYLSLVTRQTTGKTAAQWINTMVIMEAQSQLEHSTKTVQQIAMELNFTNQSFFGKFFKRITGINPTEYRNSKK